MINTIYVLRNKCNKKVYVGQTWQSLEDRWNHGHGYNGCIKIERAIQKYSKENFYYEVLTFCGTQDTANYWETFFINKYNSIKNGYNICPTGENGPMVGRKHSQKSRDQMSKSRKGTYLGEDNPFYGRHHTKDTKKIISNKLKGKPNYFMRGRKVSDVTKAKLSKAGMGQRKSIATEFKPGKKWVPNSATKLNLEIAKQIRKDYENGITGVDISNKYYISRASVSRIINNKAWNK